MQNNHDLWLEYIKSVKKIKHKIIAKQAFKTRKEAEQKYNISFNNIGDDYFLFEERRSIATLDLHGLTKEQAFDTTRMFLKKAFDDEIKKVIVITGKGKLNNPGTIKLEVPRWLQYTELKNYVASYSTAHQYLGGEGAILVSIKNKRKL